MLPPTSLPPSAPAGRSVVPPSKLITKVSFVPGSPLSVTLTRNRTVVGLFPPVVPVPAKIAIRLSAEIPSPRNDVALKSVVALLYSRLPVTVRPSFDWTSKLDLVPSASRTPPVTLPIALNTSAGTGGEPAKGGQILPGRVKGPRPALIGRARGSRVRPGR